MAKAQKSSARERALVTGASGGIGASIARNCAGGGFDLVLVARSADKLEALAEELRAAHGVDVVVMPADLGVAGAAKKLFDTLKKKKIDIDVLVNNAGVMEMAGFAATLPARHQQMISLNVAALTDMLSYFLPPMIERGRGKILNVASIAAFQPVPSLATYAATKAYVLSLTESLSEELKGKGVSITVLCPGLTETDMVAAARAANPAAAQLPSFLIGDVDDVAAQGYAAMMAREVIRVPGAMNRMASMAARAAPKWMVRAMIGAAGRFAV
ncbi:MAG: SDR family NAD(P)-dependent oxidoreductase [Parvibaculaceae bacterium]